MFRKLVVEDFVKLKEEIAKDEVHSKDAYFTPEIFKEKSDYCQSLAFEDNEGVVMYVAFHREIRVTIQFCDVKKERVRAIFENNIAKFVEAFKKAGYIGMIYSTNCKPLAYFLRKFGFGKEEVQRKVL
jgi:hypothetical protein